jgi:uncharacterized protein (DUF427 family)
MPTKPGQESVWDYPRPPRLEPFARRVRVEFNGVTVADSTRAWRLLETSHPPGYYIPAEDVRMEFFEANPRQSFCEFKGSAGYWDLRVGKLVARDVAWSYTAPSEAYAGLKDCLSFYAGRVDACYVDDERVTPQAGQFYGGWITSDLAGPFKGGPGTGGW